MDQEYISLKIKIGPESNDSHEIIQEVICLLNNFNTNYEVLYEQPFVITIYDISILKNLEILLDKYVGIYRYQIMLYEKNKKYPFTIRINKKGKKIITKNQTKYLSI
jgi:hypothetical protein